MRVHDFCPGGVRPSSDLRICDGANSSSSSPPPSMLDIQPSPPPSPSCSAGVLEVKEPVSAAASESRVQLHPVVASSADAGGGSSTSLSCRPGLTGSMPPPGPLLGLLAASGGRLGSGSLTASALPDLHAPSPSGPAARWALSEVGGAGDGRSGDGAAREEKESSSLRSASQAAMVARRRAATAAAVCAGDEAIAARCGAPPKAPPSGLTAPEGNARDRGLFRAAGCGEALVASSPSLPPRVAMSFATAATTAACASSSASDASPAGDTSPPGGLQMTPSRGAPAPAANAAAAVLGTGGAADLVGEGAAGADGGRVGSGGGASGVRPAQVVSDGLLRCCGPCRPLGDAARSSPLAASPAGRRRGDTGGDSSPGGVAGAAATAAAAAARNIVGVAGSTSSG